MLENILSDQWVVRRVLRGHSESFRILVDRYGGMVYGLAYAHLGNASDAEDVVQDTFVRLWQWLDRVTVESTLGPWLVRVAKNLVADNARLRAKECAADIDSAAVARTAEPDFARREVHAAIWSEISGLDAESREILVLSYFQGRRAKEIAGLLEISPEAAAKRLQRARAELGRRLLAAYGDDIASRKPDRARADRVMAAIAATSCGWKAGVAVSAAGAVVVGATATKLLAVAAVLAAIAVSVYFWGMRDLDTSDRAPDITAASTFTVSETSTSAAGGAGSGTTAGKADIEPSEALPDETMEDASSPAPDFYSLMRGVVVDESGQPVPAATVKLSTERVIEVEAAMAGPTYEPAPVLSLTTRSDQQGRFFFDSVPVRLGKACEADLSAEIPGFYGRISLMLNIPLREQYVEIMVRPAAALGGMVVDEKSAPVRGAVVYVKIMHLLPRTLSWNIFCVSDSSGRFLFENLEPGAYEVNCYADGYADFSGGPFETGTTNAFLVLSRGCIIAGRAIGPEGQPVGGFSVQASATSGADEYLLGRPSEVDSEGRFEIGGLKRGVYNLNIRRNAGGKPRYVLRDKVRVTVQNEVTAVELHVVNGGQIAGRVTDAATQQALADATVTAALDQNSSSTKTMADGTYVLDGAPVGEVKLAAEKEHYEKFEITLPRIEPETMLNDVNFQLHEMPMVKGIVIDSAGDPAAGALVMGRGRAGKEEYSAATGEDGRFELHITRGMKAIWLQAFDDGGLISDLLGPVQPFGREHELRLRGTGRLEGEVVDGDGTPMGDVYVFAEPDDKASRQLGQDLPHYLVPNEVPDEVRMLTDSRGMFFSPPVLAGKYGLNVRTFHEDLGESSAVVQEGQTVHARLVIDTSKYGAIEGVVTAHGRPAPNVWVKPYIYVGDRQWLEESTPSDLDGHYFLPRVLAGSGYVEVITVDRSMDVIKQPVEVAAGQTTELNIDLTGTGAGLAGHVYVDGQPCARMNVSVFPSGEEEALAELTTSYPDGEFSTAQLPEGRYTVAVRVGYPYASWLPEKYWQTVDVEVRKGETARADFDLKGGVISGEVRGIGEGEWAYVALIGGGTGMPSEFTLAFFDEMLRHYIVQSHRLEQDGPFVFEGLPPSDYAVGAVAVGAGDEMKPNAVMSGVEAGRFDFREVPMEPGQAVDVELALQK